MRMEKCGKKKTRIAKKVKRIKREMQNISLFLIGYKSTLITHHNQPTVDQIWKNFAINQLMTSKVQHSCRLMHR